MLTIDFDVPKYICILHLNSPDEVSLTFFYIKIPNNDCAYINIRIPYTFERRLV